ncbi:SDR family oxidoreductase [Lujinxingia vulgaris]|uniref:SDR family oxidoreductase n=1 Tax=Lujinxingia vulgaris TaxID=2600176 RepID=A0A5C6XCW5_9DELT|nr:SDR family oxidoreductase [Lujinxingia vulgaris]TXD37121.1 SDR family oxidoreductase [Lujinxingia vulgaris]
MDVVIVGAHGTVAMHLHPMLKERGHSVRGVIRKAEQRDELNKTGAEAILFDLENDADLATAIGQADVVVFAAGAGPGSGKARKYTVDRDGARKLIEAAKTNGIKRYIMLSAMGVDEDRAYDDEVFAAYVDAKAQADAALRESGLDYAIIRPGRLTDDEGNGHISVGKSVAEGEIPREDVAAIIAYLVEHPELMNLQFEVTSGKQSISEAFSAIVR